MCTRFASEEDYQLDSAEEKNEETTIGSLFSSVCFLEQKQKKEGCFVCFFALLCCRIF